MSLVMSCLTQDFAVISGDFRATQVKDNSVKLAGIRKVFRINENVLLGVAGDLKLSDELREHVTSIRKEHHNVQQMARICKSFLRKKIKEHPNLQQRIHLLGVGDGNKMTLIQLGHDDNFKEAKICPGPNEIRWQVIYANVPADDLIRRKVEESSEINYETVAKSLIAVNKAIADQDDFVSPECEALAITKEGTLIK